MHILGLSKAQTIGRRWVRNSRSEVKQITVKESTGNNLPPVHDGMMAPVTEWCVPHS